MVYVDELVSYSQKPQPGAARWFGNGKRSCHLTADTPEELHEFAARLGLKRTWAQHINRDTIHYDLTPSKRDLAIKLGAIEVSARDQARRRLKIRRETDDERL